MKMISMTKATLCVLGLGMGMAAFAADDLPKGPHPIPHPIDGYVPLTQQMNMCATVKQVKHLPQISRFPCGMCLSLTSMQTVR